MGMDKKEKLHNMLDNLVREFTYEEPIPKYYQLKKIIKSHILAGDLKPGEEIPSAYMLAEKFAITRVTANKALDELEREGLVTRVQGKGTAVAPGTGTREYGIVFFDMFDPLDRYVQGIVSGIEEKAKANHCHIYLYTTRGKDIKKENCLLKGLILRNQIQGLFVISPLSIQDLIFFQREGIPFVILNNEYPDLRANMVLLNHYAAAVEATRRLIREGHKRIALLTGPLERKNHVVRGGKRALSGYKEVLSGHSIPFDPSLVKTSEHSAEAGYAVMEEFLSSPEQPTAFLITSSHLTAGAYNFIRERGIEKDITIVGYFNERKEVIPPGVLVPLSQLGRISFTLLEESMGKGKESQKVKIPLEVVWE